MSKLYISIAFLCLLGLAWWRYTWVETDRDQYKAKAEKAEEQLIVNNELLVAKEKLLTEANERSTKYLADKKVIEDEAKANSECIANRTCGIELRWKTAICTGVSSTTESRPGTDESTRTGLRDFEEWYVNLETAIKKNRLKIANLQKDLLIRSDANYCTGAQQSE